MAPCTHVSPPPSPSARLRHIPLNTFPHLCYLNAAKQDTSNHGTPQTRAVPPRQNFPTEQPAHGFGDVGQPRRTIDPSLLAAAATAAVKLAQAFGAAVAPQAHRRVPRERRDEREVGVPRNVASVVAVPGQALHLTRKKGKRKEENGTAKIEESGEARGQACSLAACRTSEPRVVCI